MGGCFGSSEASEQHPAKDKADRYGMEELNVRTSAYLRCRRTRGSWSKPRLRSGKPRNEKGTENRGTTDLGQPSALSAVH